MSTEAGQWFTSGEGDRWHFDAGSLALDFAYTGPLDGTDARETMHSPADLAGWLDGRFPEVDGTATDRDLVDALTLRAVIARSAIAISRGLRPAEDDVDVINLFAATPDIPPALAGGRRQAGRAHARVSQTLSVMAREVVELFSAERADRIRQCSADDCQLIFYDESRSNNRRWCSMQRCGNRAKVRAHRARLR